MNNNNMHATVKSQKYAQPCQIIVKKSLKPKILKTEKLVWLATKYVIKSADLRPTLSTAYCEIDFALWSQHIKQWRLNFTGTIWNSNCQRHTTELNARAECLP